MSESSQAYATRATGDAFVTRVSFLSDGNSLQFIGPGWSGPEAHGSWTIGEESVLVIPLADGVRDLRLRAIVLPHVAGTRLPHQRLSVLFNGFEIAAVSISDWHTLDVAVPAAAIAGADSARITFRHPDYMQPLALGTSGDPRPLALLFQALELVGTPDQTGRPAEPPVTAHASEPHPTEATTPRDGPVFHVIPQGNIANQMIQYMVALSVAARVTELTISNVSLPDWDVLHPAVPAAGQTHHEAGLHDIDLDRVAERLGNGDVARVEYAGFGQRLENFLPLQQYREVFPKQTGGLPAFGEDDLVINVRGAEVLDAVHPGYTLIPPDFYEYLVELTGLRPVFIGQIGENQYASRLRARFPYARFIDSMGPKRDFDAVRSARNIVIAASTFSWLAAWLSDAKCIFMPVTGFFNPMQEPRSDLLPLDDARFRFFLFPVNYAVKPPLVEPTHRALSGLWREVTPEMLAEMRAARPRFAPVLADFVATFDAAYYIDRWSDARRLVERGIFASALDHYVRVGFEQRLEGFALDAAWYSRTYPLAALEVGQGDFLSLEHQYAAIGRHRGYRLVGG